VAAEQPLPDLGPSVGKVKYRRGDHTLSEDLHCRKLKLDKRATLTVTGDVTIWCDDKLEIERGSILSIDGNVVIRCDRKFEMDDRSELRMMEGATLTIYVGRKLKLDDESMLNMNTGNPQLVSIIMMDADNHEKSKFELDDGSMAAAWVQGVGASLKVDDGSEFFGSFMGRKVKVSDKSRLHVDMASGTSTDGGVVFEPEECELGDKPGTIVTAATGDVLSAATFHEWWRNVLGVNQSTVQTIRLVRSKFGVYFYVNDNYRPINGLLLGNEGQPNNYHLTVEFDADFTYDASAGQWFEIRCTDDAYLFINGRLVIDLGGYGYNKTMTIHLDRLGLTDGETYPVRLFHAQRQQGLGIFRLQTNMVLANRDGVSPAITGVLED
jgi:fibro-slime domain-containing protein